jgi:hypothetical protein
MKQTAVEWLVNELKPHIKTDWPLFRSIRNKIEQAKAMEKEQIENAFDTGTTDEDRIGKEYYNETYKK